MPYIETTTKAGNGNKTIMFPVTAHKNIIITELWNLFRNTGNTVVDIYVREGGAKTGQDGWVRIKSDISMNVLTANSITRIPANLKVNIKAGETKGFTITSSSINVGYTDSSTSYSSDDATISKGSGFGGFTAGGYNTPRVFNGRVYYELADQPPTQPGDITGIQEPLYLTSENIQFNWGTSTSQNGSAITYDIDIYDGSSWVSVATNVSEASTSIVIPSHINTDSAKIRVQAKDTSGNKSPYKESQTFSIYDKVLLVRDGDIVKSYKDGIWKVI